ncbi:hypothetical protein Aave_2351 [Paracidovorax citrulli AAC00-1]|uniref:Uncharacterized protein n=1 Tax=Paracidovorax citrulli (strain AAC00-1) TaxID=397945 RepID=A1TPN8_PARC0|nr:hypothetical protein Aave_2351 [Paracidovorax citrulli AAC00-1]
MNASRVIKSHVVGCRLLRVQGAGVQIDVDNQAVAVAFSLKAAASAQSNALVHQILGDALLERTEFNIETAGLNTALARHPIDGRINEIVKLVHRKAHVRSSLYGLKVG